MEIMSEGDGSADICAGGTEDRCAGFKGNDSSSTVCEGTGFARLHAGLTKGKRTDYGGPDFVWA